MKKLFEPPKMELILIEAEDVIVTSPGDLADTNECSLFPSGNP